VTLQSSTKSGSGGGEGSGASGASSASCPSGDPAFSMQVSFQPLPTPPTASVEKLESTATASASDETGHGGRSAVASTTAGGKR
jgi:hypothetical protein